MLLNKWTRTLDFCFSKFLKVIWICGPIERRYSDWLRAGRFGDQIPLEAKFWAPPPDRPLNPSSYLELTTHPPSRAEVIERVETTSAPPFNLHSREQVELYLDHYFKYMCLICVCRAKNGTECVGQRATWPETWPYFSSLLICLKWKTEIMSATVFILCFRYYPWLNPEQ